MTGFSCITIQADHVILVSTPALGIELDRVAVFDQFQRAKFQRQPKSQQAYRNHVSQCLDHLRRHWIRKGCTRLGRSHQMINQEDRQVRSDDLQNAWILDKNRLVQRQHCRCLSRFSKIIARRLVATEKAEDIPWGRNKFGCHVRDFTDCDFHINWKWEWCGRHIIDWYKQ